eukprot:Gb_22410 [translate_table: standard]
MNRQTTMSASTSYAPSTSSPSLTSKISGSLTSSSSLSQPNVWAKIQNEWRRVPADFVPSTPPPRPMPPTNSSTPRVSLDPVTWDPTVPEWESNASSSIAKSPFDIELPSIEEFYSTPSPSETAKPVTPFPRTKGSLVASTVLSSSINMAKHLGTSGSLDYTTKGSIEPNQLPSNIISPLSESSDFDSPLLVAITGNIPHVDTSQHVPLPSPPPIPIGFSTFGLQNNSTNPPPTLEHTPPTRRVPTLEQTLPPSRIMPFDPLSLNSSFVCNYTDTNLTSVPPTEHPSSFSLLVINPLNKSSLNNGNAPSLPCLEDPPVTNPHSGNCSSPPCDSPSRVSSHECFPPVRDIPLSVCDSLLSTSSSKCPVTGISLPFTDKTLAFDMPSSSANQQTWPKFDLVDLFTTNLPEDIKKISEWCREVSWNLSSSAPYLHLTADPNNNITILSLSSAWTIQDYLIARILLKIDLLNYVDFTTKDLHQASGWFLIWLHQISAAPEWWKLPLTDAGYYSFYIFAKMDAFQNYIWDVGG